MMQMFNKKGSKYNNKKPEAYGRKWDSQMELEFYEYNLALKEQGQVIDIEIQPVFLLQDKYIYKGKTIRKMEYKADFKITYSDGSVIVYDVKGQLIQPFPIKWKLVRFIYNDMDFRCIRSKGRKPNKIWEEMSV